MEDKYALVYCHHLCGLHEYEAMSKDVQVLTTQICWWIYKDRQ